MKLIGHLNGAKVYDLDMVSPAHVKMRPDKLRQRVQEIDWIKTGDRLLIIDNNNKITLSDPSKPTART